MTIIKMKNVNKKVGSLIEKLGGSLTERVKSKTQKMNIVMQSLSQGERELYA